MEARRQYQDQDSSAGNFKILSIDGGGIKGIYSAQILAQYEAEYGVRTCDVFDLLCGTSTGGLIALALSLGIPSAEIVEFYQTSGKEIFPAPSAFARFRHAWRGKYSQERIRKELTDMFGDRTIEDSLCLLCIPAFSLTNYRPFVYKYDHEFLPGRDNSSTYVEVALATCAAPTFFPVARNKNITGQRLIDGGVYANNPSLIGLTEALRYFVGSGKQYQIASLLSIPSFEIPGGERPGRSDRVLSLSWLAKLPAIASAGNSFTTDYILQTLQNHSDIPFLYHRVQQDPPSPEHATIIGLDKASDEAISLLSLAGKECGMRSRKEEPIKRFFSNRRKERLDHG